MPDVDIAVIGGGAVGLACAARLAQKRSVALIERHGGFGYETSSHNSGVIHAGIYYPTGSLKHRLCIEGAALLYAWCDAHGVRSHRTGKLIVAVDEDDLPALHDVHAQALRNGVGGIELIDDAVRLRELEPHVRCIAALLSPNTGVVDVSAFMASLAAEAREQGAMIALRHDVTAIERVADGFVLDLRNPDGEVSRLSCGALVNSAGLGAPAIATMLRYPLAGADGVPVLRQYVNKGRYFDIVPPEKARLLTRLVYPVPEHTHGGLGVHVTLDADGGVHLGPDTEWLDDGAPLDYRADDARRADFHAAASRYLPWLEPGDLAPGQVGYRPKLQAPGGPPADFLIWHDRGYVHVGGMESPGLTASLAIAGEVARALR